jgi:hypothetical protein
LTASSDGRLRLWSAEGTLEATLEGHADAVWHACFSPDGRLLASASRDGTARLWSAEGVELAALEGHTGPVRMVAFSPDGRLLASCSKDTTVRLYELDGDRPRLRAVLGGHTGPVNHVAFGWGGERLVSASEDGSARVWSGAGELVAVLPAKDGQALQMAVFGGERAAGEREPCVVTAGAKGALQIFPLATLEELLARAAAVARREGLSPAQRAEFHLPPGRPSPRRAASDGSP